MKRTLGWKPWQDTGIALLISISQGAIWWVTDLWPFLVIAVLGLALIPILHFEP